MPISEFGMALMRGMGWKVPDALVCRMPRICAGCLCFLMTLNYIGIYKASVPLTRLICAACVCVCVCCCHPCLMSAADAPHLRRVLV